MERIPVTSSNIAAVGYDPDAQILEVEFAAFGKRAGTHRPVWQYSFVTPVEYANLINNFSIGRAFAAIRNAKPAKKIALIDENGIEHPIEEAV